MGFRYKQKNVTLDNYRDIFDVCTPDVLDEIRSAVLDDTSIANFIKPCGNDSYKLGQLRMAVRELVPVEYLNTNLTGKTVYYIRQGFSKGRDMSALLRYINERTITVEADTLQVLAEYVFLGTDITKVDFTIVPNNLLNIVCRGLYQGYPMWLLIEEGTTLSESTIHILMRGLQLGVDVHPFINGDWNNDSLLLIFSYAKTIDLNLILPYINSNFDTETLRVLLDLVAKGIPISTLCVKDTAGMPVYNRYQMFEIGQAIEDGTVTQEMYKVTMSDMDIATLHSTLLAERNRKLSASLGKKI